MHSGIGSGCFYHNSASKHSIKNCKNRKNDRRIGKKPRSRQMWQILRWGGGGSLKEIRWCSKRYSRMEEESTSAGLVREWGSLTYSIALSFSLRLYSFFFLGRLKIEKYWDVQKMEFHLFTIWKEEWKKSVCSWGKERRYAPFAEQIHFPRFHLSGQTWWVAGRSEKMQSARVCNCDLSLLQLQNIN